MKMLTIKNATVALGGVLAGAALFASTASATNIPVSVTTDDVGVNGNCTLREAVKAANTDAASDACPAGSNDDYILLQSAGPYTLTIPPDGTPDDNADGDLDISGELTITGVSGRPLIDQNASDRVLHAHSGVLELIDLAITGGGAVTTGGGVYAKAPFGAERVTFYANSALNGGAVTGEARVSISDSRLAGNAATAGNGGALELSADPGNTVTESSFEGNGALVRGGAVDVFGNGELTVRNSTFTGNVSPAGAAVYTAASAGGMHLLNSTVAGNTATTAGRGALDAVSAPDILVKRTILAENNDPNGPRNCGSPIDPNDNDAFNLEDADTCGMSADAEIGNLTNTNPQLAPVGLYDGGTLVRPPYAGSPALDAIPAARCGLPSTDQHFTERPLGGACDVGAFEGSIAKPPVPPKVTPPDQADPRCASLRAQLKKAKGKKKAKKVKTLRKKLRKLGC
jgi:CSLREA domain-containing protein